MDEFAGRHHIREMDALDQMTVVAAWMVGKRLKYRDLIADTGLTQERVRYETPRRLSMTKHPLLHGMYHVSASATHDGQRVDAVHSIPVTDDVTALCLFDRHNPEIFVKVLDGSAVNGHRWVFIAGMTDLECEVVVEEVSTGCRWMHRSKKGEQFQPVSDVNAFPCQS